jgi:hypothetical protein
MGVPLTVQFHHIKVNNDHDPDRPWYLGGKDAGDIFISSTISDGFNTDKEKLGEYEIHSGKTKILGEKVASFDDVDNLIKLDVDVWDHDTLTSNDDLGHLSLVYTAENNFGIGNHLVMGADHGLDYDLSFSIVSV